MKKSIKILMGLTIVLFATIFCGLMNFEPEVGIGLMVIAPVVVAGIKTSVEYRQDKADVWALAEGIVNKAKKEKRGMTDDEKTEYDGYVSQMKTFDADIKRAEEHEKRMAEMAGGIINKRNEEKENKELKEFSFLRFMRGAMKNKLEGFEAEMHTEAVKEARGAGVEISGYGVPSFVPGVQKRDMSATGGSSGSEGGVMVQTDVTGFIDALTAKMVMKEMGATFLTGLVGNVDIPKITSASSAAWEGENDAGAETQPTFGKVSLTPNRLGAYAQVSKQLINQVSYDAEQIARNDIERAIRLAVELAAINGSGSSNQPTGILNQSGIGAVAGGTNGLAPTWAHIVNLEKEVAVDNADMGNLHYLTNPNVRAKLKTVAVGTDQRMVWDILGNSINGYSAGVTSQVPSTLDKGTSTGVCSAIIFGNFADLLIANWAGLDIVVDPYTSAKTGFVDLVINSWWDVDVRHAQSFSAMKDALTT